MVAPSLVIVADARSQCQSENPIADSVRVVCRDIVIHVLSDAAKVTLPGDGHHCLIVLCTVLLASVPNSGVIM